MAVPSASTTTAPASAAARKASKAAASKVPAAVRQTDGTAPTAEVAATPARKLVPEPSPVPDPATAFASPANAPAVSAVRAHSSSLPLVTVGEIQAAAQIVSARHSGKQRMAYLGGRSAASLDELKSVVRSLAKAGRLAPQALEMLAESDADEARNLLETSDSASTGVGDAVRGAMRESVLADFAHSVEIAEVGTDNAGMVRDVYRSAWWAPQEGTIASETAAEVKQTASEVDDVLSDEGGDTAADAVSTESTPADKGTDNAEITPVDIALDIANHAANDSASGQSGQSGQSGEQAEQAEQE